MVDCDRPWRSPAPDYGAIKGAKERVALRPREIGTRGARAALEDIGPLRGFSRRPFGVEQAPLDSAQPLPAETPR